MTTFAELESKGLVRFRTVPDHEPYDDSYLECQDASPEEVISNRKELWHRIDHEGVWGIIGEARCSHCGNWEQVDSCYGFIGDDWRDSGYDKEIKRACVRFVEEKAAKS